MKARQVLHRWMATVWTAVFFFTSLSHAQESFWQSRRPFAERKDGRPGNPRRPSPFATVSFTPPLDSPFARLNGILEMHGEVRAVHDAGPGAPVVIHLQDLHGVPEAQENLRLMVKALAAGGTTLAGLEGAVGSFGQDAFRRLPRQDIVESLLPEFVRLGLLSGPEAAGLTAGDPLELWGIEDERLYRSNVRTLSSDGAGLGANLKEMSRAADLRRKNFPENLRSLEEERRAFAEGTRGLTEHARGLWAHRGAGEFPEVKKFLEVARLEESIDRDSLEQEKELLLNMVAARVSLESLEALAKSRAAPRTYYRSLCRLLEETRIPLERFPAFSLYVRHLRLADDIDRDAFARQLEALERHASLATAETLGLKAQLEANLRLELVEKLFRRALNPAEWKRYGREKEAVKALPGALGIARPTDWPQALDPYERFTRLAERRDEALAGNLLARMRSAGAPSAILVAGGFHTQGILRRLSRESVSWIVCAPRVSLSSLAADPTDVFHRRFPLAEFFNPAVNHLAYPPVTQDNPAVKSAPADGRGRAGSFRLLFAAAYLGFLSLTENPVVAQELIQPPLRALEAKRRSDGSLAVTADIGAIEKVGLVVRLAHPGDSREKLVRLGLIPEAAIVMKPGGTLIQVIPERPSEPPLAPSHFEQVLGPIRRFIAGEQAPEPARLTLLFKGYRDRQAAARQEEAQPTANQNQYPQSQVRLEDDMATVVALHNQLIHELETVHGIPPKETRSVLWHSERVLELVFHLGPKLGMTPAEIKSAALAALWHDLGKYSEDFVHRHLKNNTTYDRMSEDHARVSDHEGALFDVTSRLGVDLSPEVRDRLRAASAMGRHGEGDISGFSLSVIQGASLLNLADVLDSMNDQTRGYVRARLSTKGPFTHEEIGEEFFHYLSALRNSRREDFHAMAKDLEALLDEAVKDPGVKRILNRSLSDALVQLGITRALAMPLFGWTMVPPADLPISAALAPVGPVVTFAGAWSGWDFDGFFHQFAARPTRKVPDKLASAAGRRAGLEEISRRRIRALAAGPASELAQFALDPREIELLSRDLAKDSAWLADRFGNEFDPARRTAEVHRSGGSLFHLGRSLAEEQSADLYLLAVHLAGRTGQALLRGMEAYNAAMGVGKIGPQMEAAINDRRPIAVEISASLLEGLPGDDRDETLLAGLDALAARPSADVSWILPEGKSVRDLQGLLARRGIKSPSTSKVIFKSELKEEGGLYSVGRLLRKAQGVGDSELSRMDLFLMDRNEWVVEDSVSMLARLLVILEGELVIDVTDRTSENLRHLNYVATQA